MAAFLARRVLAGLALILMISTLTFWLMHVMGGDPARAILGQTATKTQVADKARELGLDRPVLTQFADWSGSALRGDFGTSWFTHETVAQSLSHTLPVTLSVVFAATLLSAVISFGLGAAAAIRRGWVDRLVQILAVVGFALPGFWLALMFAVTFAVNLGWFPATGYVTFADSPADWLKTITLPATALSVGAIGAIAQQVRGSLLDVMQQDYIRTLRSRGLSERAVLLRHALRNAAPPAVSILGLQFIGLLGGAVMVERVFALPGIGSMAVNATTSGDVPMVMGLVVVTVIIVVAVNLSIDVVQGWLNPKVRVR